MTELRASIFIDQLQPQTLAYIATWMRGTLPRLRDRCPFGSGGPWA